MKTFKRVLFSLSVSLLMFFTISVTSLAADTDIQAQQQYNCSTTSLDRLVGDVDVSALGSYLEENVYNCVSDIDVSQFNIPYTHGNFDAIAEYIYDDLIEAFHVKGVGCSYICSEPSTFLKIKVSYSDNYPKELYTKYLEQCRLTAEKILEGIADNPNLTDTEKLLFIHDRLLVLCEYDYDNYLNYSVPEESYTICGPLVHGTAVCQGYARTYKYLLDKIGIYSEICSSEQLRHAWNIVYLDGIPYHVDVTFDDPLPDTPGRAFHRNFLLSDEAIRKADHDATDIFTGATDTRYDNSFWRGISSPFIYYDNDLYYIESSTGNIIKNSDKSILTNTNAAWSKWYYNDAKLVTDGRCLYYSGYDSIYKYNPITKTTKVIFTLDSNQYKNYYIEGFIYKNGIFYYSLCSTSDYSDTIKNLSFTYVDTETLPQTPVLIEIDGTLYYYNNGEIDYSETLVFHNQKWYYVNNGKAQSDYTGLAYYCNAWFYIENGQINWSYTGLVEYCGNYFHIENGVLDWSYTGLSPYYGEWFYVENGILNWDYTGITYYCNTWFYVEKGYLNWNKTTLAYAFDSWFYIENGQINWSYTGLAEYCGNYFHIENGVLDWSYSGLSYYYGDWFYVTNGIIDWSYTGYTNYYGNQFYVENGYLDWSKQ